MPQTDNFFTPLGKRVCAEISNPPGRARIGDILREELRTHISRPPPMAMDQNPMGRSMPRGPVYSGDQDPNLRP
jgi:hypothetical protein